MDEETDKTFAGLVADLDAGKFDADLTESLRELVSRLRGRAELNGTAKGEIAVKIKFVCGDNGRIEIETDTTIKQPGPPKSSDTKWVTPDGSLVGSDPRQQKLPLKTPSSARDTALKTPGKN